MHPLRYASLLLLASLCAAGDAFIAWRLAEQGLDLGAGNGVIGLASGPGGSTWAVVDQGGLFASRDGGITWTRTTSEVAAVTEPGGAAASPTDAQVALAWGRGDGQGLWRTADGGRTWTRCSGLASEDTAGAAFAADGSLVIAGARSGSKASLSRDAGATWSPIDLGAAVEGQLPFIIDAQRWVVMGTAKANAIRCTADGGASWAAATGAVDYFPGLLPAFACGDALFSAKHHGFNLSTDAGATWRFVMTTHVRVVGAAGTVAFREDRSALPGTKDRTLKLEMSADLGQSWQDATCGLLDAVPAPRRAHLVVPWDKDPYAHLRLASAWSAAPDRAQALLALGKAGVYLGEFGWSTGGPVVGQGRCDPLSTISGERNARVTLTIPVVAKKGKVTRVIAELASLGLGQVEMLDDGAHGDGASGDGMYGTVVTIPPTASAGKRALGVIASDDKGRRSSSTISFTIGSTDERTIVWDGDKVGRGQAWVSPQNGINYLKPQSETVKDGRVALELFGKGGGYIGGGWNWHGWYPANAGDDIRRFRNLSFWMKVEGEGDIGTLGVSLNSNNAKTLGDRIDLRNYCRDITDGQWHEVVIPLEDMYEASKEPGFNPAAAWELGLSSWAPGQRTFSIFVDGIGFDNRPVRPHSRPVIAAEERQPVALADPAAVAATVDLASAGRPVSPYIYGVAFGDLKHSKLIGVTARRAGGNPLSPMDWRTGFSSAGADWYYVNTGTQTPPEKNWLVTWHQGSREAGMASYVSIPLMGRVAKDGTSSAFDIGKYPDQESWVAKVQPADPHPNAGNGRQLVKGADGKPVLDAKGQPTYKDLRADPDDSSKAVSVEEQAEVHRFMIEKMGYGTADKGGIPFLALDNEPMLWSSTHRGMRPDGVGFDELWDITRRSATLFKGWDPKVKIAGPTLWGWTAYFNSGRDVQLINQGKGSWDEAPDRKEHGGEPFALWYLRQVAEHKRKTGVQLIDLLDFHFYPQNGIYMGGVRNDPAWMEKRVQETRVMWDPDFVDQTWMGRGKSEIPHLVGKPGVIALTRLMRKWIKEAGLEGQIGLSFGEYNFGGEGDVSGGVAQCELFGVFAREGVDHAYLWTHPGLNDSLWFAWKMFRDPDGSKSAWGDQVLPVTVDAKDDVSVHAARDQASGRISLVLVNKRAAKPARVTIALGRAVARQSVRVWEYGPADPMVIGLLPAREIGGDRITVDLPAMSVQRLDFKP